MKRFGTGFLHSLASWNEAQRSTVPIGKLAPLF